jgi:micrococcal nuclease
MHAGVKITRKAHCEAKFTPFAVWVVQLLLMHCIGYNRGANLSGEKGMGIKADGRRTSPLLFVMPVAAVILGGAYGWATMPPADTIRASFSLCGDSARVTCVVDGDTFWLGAVKYRISDIDTPEISEPRCQTELALGEQAKYRLLSLLNEGPFGLKAGLRDEDKYGRKLRAVYRGGQSLGDVLVEEGLARTWTGQRMPWC